MNIDYESRNSKPVRDDYSESHSRYWKRLASPGAWLTGAQRVAVAKEVRAATSCKLCAERKAALSPYAVKGEHDCGSSGELTDVMIDMIHRCITDQARLTKTWFDSLPEQGLKVEEYVEILGTIVHLFSIDEWCRGVGLSLNELPEPIAGKPSYYRPEGLDESGKDSWAPILPAFVEEGPEADIWEGPQANVIRALTLVPDEARSLMDLIAVHYIPMDSFLDMTAVPFNKLTRYESELVATRVSSYNDCFY